MRWSSPGWSISAFRTWLDQRVFTGGGVYKNDGDLIGFNIGDGQYAFTGRVAWRLESDEESDRPANSNAVLGVVPAGLVIGNDRAPREVRLVDPRTGEQIVAVTDVEKREPDATMFDVPANYKRVDETPVN